MPATEDKASLRQRMLLARKRFAPEAQASGSRSICRQLQSWPLFQQAGTVMGYLAMPGEPNLDALLAAAIKAGKIVCAPFMGPVYGVMESAVIAGFDRLITGRLGVRMPDPARSRIVDPGLIDLVFVPGVAFDKDGGRLGMGAGYYDRFLLQAPQAVRVGIGWSQQIVAEVPRTTHDILMQWVVTEHTLIHCS